MTWLIEQRDDKPAGERLADHWKSGKILRMPGAHDAMAALLAKEAGFEALYLSGGALSASLGLPDLGVMTQEEVLDRTKSIVRASGLPLLVDGDTGYGEALNVMRLIGELEMVGAAAVQLEDQILPKKCGHLSDKRLAEPQAMAAKIAAAKKARKHLRIIARTDAAASEGFEGAVARAKLYVEAGADAIFPEALGNLDGFRAFAERMDVPLLANMTEFGKTDYISAEAFEDAGYAMVIWPVSSLRVASAAIRDLYAHLAETGSPEGFLNRMQTRQELYATLGYSDYERLDGSIAVSVIPGTESNSKKESY